MEHPPAQRVGAPALENVPGVDDVAKTLGHLSSVGVDEVAKRQDRSVRDLFEDQHIDGQE
jgi:hypothetical protein